MKITRAYTIDIETKRILDSKPNKSEYVCRAVRKLHRGDGTTLQDFSNAALIGALQSRFDRHSAQYRMVDTLIALLQPQPKD